VEVRENKLIQRMKETFQGTYYEDPDLIEKFETRSASVNRNAATLSIIVTNKIMRQVFQTANDLFKQSELKERDVRRIYIYVTL